MTLIEHSNAILDYFMWNRLSDGRFRPIQNVELLCAMGRQPADYAVTYGQASSLLDIASLKAGLPLIGRLIEFDRDSEDDAGWADWKPFQSLIYHTAPRLTHWYISDISSLRSKLQSGAPSILWKGLESESVHWLGQALQVAQAAIRAHAELCQKVNAQNRAAD